MKRPVDDLLKLPNSAQPTGAGLMALDDDLALHEVLDKLRKEHGIRCSYARLWALIMQGDVPAHRIGRRLRVKRGNVPAAAKALGTPSSTAA
jgi:hypothetical protein